MEKITLTIDADRIDQEYLHAVLTKHTADVERRAKQSGSAYDRHDAIRARRLTAAIKNGTAGRRS